ncbi:hypothetical protein N7532_000277 [Penicillium argentinense]|uniref:Pentatricopeptide repeat protein n=1 Tax=Penicillium argentinense TaxID=1131581 RepID=A0A9W9KNP3_9EURO|nr:uncharacterized protein N7532_000277 [Penicillium argentinense]KAJ5112232.1 hypothetical protein N7532_000277 [Penicillium argentinense]
MSLCPHQYTRSRLSGLLSTQCSSPGRWHRSLCIPCPGNAANVSTSTPFNHDSAAKEDHLANATIKLDSIANGDSPENEISTGDRQSRLSDDPSHQDETLTRNSNSASRQTNSRPRRNFAQSISKTFVRKRLNAHGNPHKLTHHITRRLNAELRTNKRYLNERSLGLAIAIRGDNLYSRELGLRQWRIAYKEVYVSKRYGREITNKSLIPALKEDGTELLEKARSDCRGSFRETWHALDRPTKARHWQRLAFWMMQHDPKALPDFLLVTTEGNDKPQFTITFDCIRFLENFYYADWLQDWRSGTHTYQSLVESCLPPRDWPIVTLAQKGVRLYVRRAGHQAVVSAFRIVRERTNQMCGETALCFMWRFTELGEIELALKALELTLQLKDLKKDSKGVMRHCCKLLTLDTVKDDKTGRNFHILPRLLKLGIQPDRDMMNVVLANAFKTGDPRIGNDMLQYMKDQEHIFDSYTYLTLLQDAIARGDRGQADSLIHEVETQEDLRKNPFLASKIFHSHYTFSVKHMDADADPSRVFYSMLDMYNQLYDIRPLKELTIVPPHYTPREGSKIPPGPVVLFLMIATFFRCQRGLPSVQRIYSRFREFAQQGHPLIAPLAATDHVYNEFLIALRGDARGLRSCVHLVEDMLKPSSSEVNGQKIDHAKPSMRTWCILLSAFLWNGHQQAATKIRQMMDKHKVKYNGATWNVIINGYANQQDIPQTAKAIKKMEEDGFAIDPYTMKSLRYLRDPERLWVAIDELDQTIPEATPAQPTQQPESTPKVVGSSDEQQQERLLDEGLGKLGTKMKPKL